MEQAKLEARITELERQLADIKLRIDMLSRPNDWRSVIGMFAGDEGMKEVFEEARKIREEDRRRTKPKPSKRTKQARS